MGALPALRSLSLAHCTGIRRLPEAIGELHELAVVNLEGCIGITSLPVSFSTMACLRTLYVHHTHSLDEAALKHLPASVQIVRDSAPRPSDT